jgi:hypothetical protein
VRFIELLGAAGQKRQRTAAELAHAIPQAEAERDRLAGEHDALAAKRAAALLDSDDSAVDRVEAQQAQTLREIDRVELVIDELRRRVTAAEAREQQAACDALYERGLAAQRAQAALLKRYGSLADQLCRLLLEVNDTHAELLAANASLAKAGDPRHVEGGERALSTAPYTSDASHLSRNVKLPDPLNAAQYHWPPAGGIPAGRVLDDREAA